MPDFVHGGRDKTPGVSTVVQTFENEFIWGNWGNVQFVGAQLASTALDVGNTGYTSILRSGLLLGEVTATKKLKEWNPTGTDGSEYIYGILKESRSVLVNNTAIDRLTGPIAVSGGLVAGKIIVPGTTAPGIVGNALEHLIREQLRGRFMFDDSYKYNRPAELFHAVTAGEQGTGLTLTAVNSHTHYNNTGGTLAVALGALVPYKGLEFTFTAHTATTDQITVTTTGSLIKAPGASAAASLAVDATTKRLVGTGALWLVESL